MKPLLVLKTGSTVPGVRARRGDFEDWFLAGLDVGAGDSLVVAVHLGEEPPPPGEVSGVVVTGSPAMATEGAEWSLRAERWLADAVRARVPVLGVCYGHQLLARALGGRVDWNPRGREIGTVPVQLAEAAAEDPLFAGLPSPLFVQTTHSQSVVVPPPGARVLARNTHDAFQALAIGERAWSVQFHPEFDADIVRGYLTERADDVRADGSDPEAISAAVTETPHAASLLERFSRLRADGG